MHVLVKPVLDKFLEVVCASKKPPPVKHKPKHVIETTTPRPVTARYRRLDGQRLMAAKQEFSQMEAQGIIRKSKSNWASPFHMVEKADSPGDLVATTGG